MESFVECESPIEKGMIAKVIFVKDFPGSDDETYKKFVFDLSVAKEENMALLSHDWFTHGNETGTAIEAGFLKEDLIEYNILSFEDERDFPAEFVAEGPLKAYLEWKVDNTLPLTYVEWLENSWVVSQDFQKAIETTNKLANNGLKKKYGL